MKKIFFLFFIIINCISFGKETLKVKIPKNNTDMYLYRNMEEGRYKGVYVELFDRVKDKIDKEVSYSLKSENPDIILRVVDKNEYKDYTLLQMPISYRVAVLVKNDGRLKKISELHGLKVGYVENNRGIEEIQKRFKELKFEKVALQNKSKAIESLENGEVDGLILIDWTNSNTLETSTRALENFLYREHIAVRKDLEEVIGILEKEIKEIKGENLDEIIRENRIEFYQYLLKDMPDYKFVKENFKNIKVGFPKDKYLLPLYYESNGKLKGILPNILEDLEKILDIPFSITKGEDWDVNAIMVRDRQLDKKYRFTRPYYKSKMAIANRKMDSFEITLSDLDNEKIIMLKDEDLKINISQVVDKPEIIYVETLQEGIEKLRGYQGNFLFSYTGMIEGIITNNFLEKDIKIAGMLNEEVGICMGFDRKNEELAQVFRSIMESFSVDKTIVDQEANKNILFERNYKLIAKIAIPTIMFIIILISLIIKSEKNRKKAEGLSEILVKTMESINQLDEEEAGDHAQRLALYSELMAKECSTDKNFVENIRKFTSLHDIGKVVVPREILNKPGKLTEAEFEKVKQHTDIGYKLAQKLGVGKIAENLVRFHHEKWNGKGYPLGLSEEKIPLEGRIVALADTYDNLRQDKVYRKGFSHEKSLEIILEESGKSFDPKLVEIFIKNHKRFEKIFEENNKSVYLADEIYTAIKNK